LLADKGDQDDWEITSDGLYIATRNFLIRRGYCCANRCRNCPYINWRSQPEWQPIPAEQVKRTRVCSKSIIAAQTLLDYHQQQLHQCLPLEQERHQRMVDHYRNLLACWRANG
jgi:Family of unknown function (DUF5522)